MDAKFPCISVRIDFKSMDFYWVFRCPIKGGHDRLRRLRKRPIELIYWVLRYSSSTTMASYFFSSSSSLASQSPHPWRYDVFISFRGEDTRRSFTSHLYDALCRNALLTFIDDDEFQRGEEIAPSLLQAIQESNVAVVVFSKNYASSIWCLDELVKIIECHQNRGQIVIPIFYEVNPSHIRNQSHNVAAAFERHEQNLRNAHMIQNWRDALTVTTNLSGFDSKDFRYDHLLISKIVEDISKKLKKSTLCDGDELLVGADSHFMQIKNRILSVEGLDVYIIGIWGMGGIGKTTIAEFIFKRLSSEFEGCCFLKNVRERSKVRDLRKELISQLLGEKDRNVYAFPKTRLGRRRTLIVLDDVDDSQQLDSLIGDTCWFGSRSVIIITGRDKQVLGRRVGFLYKVEPLQDEEALQLFSWSAFKQNNPKNDYESLSNSIIEYAQGNPLALKVLGSSLSGKTTKEWESALKKLSKGPIKNIQDVLQIGYDRLDGMEKDIFLHIACFFKGQNKDVVMRVLESCEFDADIIVSVLVDKCFVTIPGNTLEMHDLMQEMGKEIVRQESKHPNERSRLWDPKDVFKVIEGNEGAEAVESIILDVSIREIDLNPEVFMKIPNLKFLKFYVPNRYDCFEEQSKLRLSQGLDYLPNELAYFHWDGYPLESFPSNFRPNRLIVLKLRKSKIKQFQEEVRDENIGYSVTSQLSCGKFGTILCRFCSLIKIPSFMYGWQLGKVTSLSLVDCKNISHLPNSRVGLLEAVENLNLDGCLNLKTFPEVSSNIKSMNLSWTAIEQIPSSSVEHLGKLEELVMFACRNLESLPSNFFDALTSLSRLDLAFCIRIKKLPEISENAHSLESLSFCGGDLEIPYIGNLKGLKTLNIYGSSKITFVRTSVANLVSLELVNLAARMSHHPVIDQSLLPWLLEGASSLRTLNLGSLKLRELPEDLSFLSSITDLYLRDNNFERVPATIKQLSNLRQIDLSHCQRLISLPELPSNVFELRANNCTSLEQIWALKQLVFESKGIHTSFSLWNCLKLDEDECQEVANVLFRYHKPWKDYHMYYYPGSRIPEWVKYQSLGSSMEVTLPSHWLNRLFLGFALYVSIDSKNWGATILRLRCDWYFGDNYHVAITVPETFQYKGIGETDKEHVVVFCRAESFDWIRRHGNCLGDVALFKFSEENRGMKFIFSVENQGTPFKFSEEKGVLKILKCGVTPVYSQDQDELCQTFEFPTLVSTVKIKEAVVADSKVRKRRKKTVCGLSTYKKKKKE